MKKNAQKINNNVYIKVECKIITMTNPQILGHHDPPPHTVPPHSPMGHWEAGGLLLQLDGHHAEGAACTPGSDPGVS